MLCLTRKVGQRITIGDNIIVVVNSITGSRVTLGIIAPREIQVTRDDAKQRTQQDARQGTDSHTEVYADADEAIKEQTP